jgi:hypothetical protein
MANVPGAVRPCCVFMAASTCGKSQEFARLNPPLPFLAMSQRRQKLALVAQGKEGNKASPGQYARTRTTRALSQASLRASCRTPRAAFSWKPGHTPRVRGGRGAGGWLAPIYPPQRTRKKNGGRELVDGRKGEGGDGQALLSGLQ